MNMTLVAFDFGGSGQSEGEFISLGFHEREELKVIMERLRVSDSVSAIGLWGRSMGAVTALLHVDRDPSIAGLVLDSPFASLKDLAKELFRRYSTKMPGFFFTIAFRFIRSTVKKKAKFDLNTITPIKHVHQAFVPAFFVAAEDDDFVLPHHARDLHARYAGEKSFVECVGDHNSPRPDHLMTAASIFLHNATLGASIPEFTPSPTDASITRSFPSWNSFYQGYDPSLFDPALGTLLLEDAKTSETFPVVGASPFLGPSLAVGEGEDEEEKKLEAMLDQLSLEEQGAKSTKGFSFNAAVDEVL